MKMKYLDIYLVESLFEILLSLEWQIKRLLDIQQIKLVGVLAILNHK